MGRGKARQIVAREEIAAVTRPLAGTVEAWAWDYIHTVDLEQKCSPGPPPSRWEPAAPVRRISCPGRPKELEVIARSPRTPKPGALVRPKVRAQLFHTFWHHELQAAELFAWAILAFPGTPVEFRRGLLGICLEEIGHMKLYAEYFGTQGFAIGDFPVRDWFWQRVPMAETADQFVALVGLGLESGNLDHGALFAPRLRAVGDLGAAKIVDQVSKDEEAHVAFGASWFARLRGRPKVEFETWRTSLPEPLSPILFRGKPLNRKARKQAGQDDDFLDALSKWEPSSE
ncbi:MAG: DUF455 family protein [Planctomycetota bacterium]|nr:DUF455 family protein [Planctomycetota bacterium]MDG2143750.1 DUF455 family protein [Planctomycetota bacterium]